MSTPRIRVESIDIPSLIPVIEHMQGRGIQIVIKNYTTDIMIPVFRTWIVNPNDYRYYATNGFGANPDPAVALERSISEAYQPMEFVNNEEQRAYRGPSATQLAFSYYSLYSLYPLNKLEILGESF